MTHAGTDALVSVWAWERNQAVISDPTIANIYVNYSSLPPIQYQWQSPNWGIVKGRFYLVKTDQS